VGANGSFIVFLHPKKRLNMKRVVITGLGALTPIGNTVSEYWQGLKAGVSGAAPITHFDAEKFRTRFACEVKGFDATQFMDRREIGRTDLFCQYALASAQETKTASA
jgi:3-oxoacyl-[acyl-carrier-protein] synthase II